MLSATIVLDSVGFDIALKDTRWVSLDLESFRSLEGSLEDYALLSEAKFDVEANLGMGLMNMLRKDCAEICVAGRTVIFSSVVVPLERLLELDVSALVKIQAGRIRNQQRCCDSAELQHQPSA